MVAVSLAGAFRDYGELELELELEAHLVSQISSFLLLVLLPMHSEIQEP